VLLFCLWFVVRLFCLRSVLSCGLLGVCMRYVMLFLFVYKLFTFVVFCCLGFSLCCLFVLLVFVFVLLVLLFCFCLVFVFGALLEWFVLIVVLWVGWRV